MKLFCGRGQKSSGVHPAQGGNGLVQGQIRILNGLGGGFSSLGWRSFASGRSRFRTRLWGRSEAF